MTKKLKVAVGMSGGVDSGVSAKLLVDAGYDVAGVHLHFWAEHDPYLSRENKCCSTESLMAARKTCDMLGIPFYTFNFEDIFKETVVEYFLAEFKALRTPNPCVVCNRKIKTGRLVKYVQGLGFDMLATGHYINVAQQNGDGYDVLGYEDMERRSQILEDFPNHPDLFLKMGNDDKKDQSYFLYTMKQEDLVRLVFPLGNMVKDDVRRLANEWKLPVATSKESFDICFIPGDNYRDFLQRHMPEWIIPGDVVDTEGSVIGAHQGLPFYAVGQRRGFTTNKIVPYYVVGFDKDKNHLIVGKSAQTERSTFSLHSSTFASDVVTGDVACQVRLRHMGGFTEGVVARSGDSVLVTLKDGQRGVSPGQSAVFYRDRVLLGGGVIDTVLH
ncbi:MAG: tRNA 2-thiouridine(34) synthase MnmA [bacterium]|nr:tRNA 2-thiouridine(34) synthase MnmA [bacterium]